MIPIRTIRPAQSYDIPSIHSFTQPETNMFASENQRLEDENPFGTTYFQGRLLAVSFRDCTALESPIVITMSFNCLHPIDLNYNQICSHLFAAGKSTCFFCPKKMYKHVLETHPN